MRVVTTAGNMSGNKGDTAGANSTSYTEEKQKIGVSTISEFLPGLPYPCFLSSIIKPVLLFIVYMFWFCPHYGLATMLVFEGIIVGILNPRN